MHRHVEMIASSILKIVVYIVCVGCGGRLLVLQVMVID